MTTLPKTIAEAERIAAERGITLTAQDYADMEEVIARRESQLIEPVEPARSAGWVDRFNRIVPKLIKGLVAVGDVAAAIIQAAFIGPGVLLVLFMLLVVEQSRVSHGISLFEAHGHLAMFMAWAFVIGNLALELLIAWQEHKAGYVEPTRHYFSFRLWRQRAAYVLGRGGKAEWMAQPKSPAIRFRVALRVLTMTILLLALAGSMKDAITKTPGTWDQALVTILTKSALIDAVTWVGGLAGAFAAVIVARVLSRYVADKMVEVVAALQSTNEDKPRAVADALGMTGAAFIYARIQQRLKEQRVRQRVTVATAAEMPRTEDVVPLVPSTQGHLSHVPVKTGQMGQAVQMLRDNPEWMGRTLRKLEEDTGINKNIWGKAKHSVRE